jgi:chitinase
MAKAKLTVRARSDRRWSAAALALLIGAVALVLTVVNGGGSKHARSHATLAGASPETPVAAPPWFAPYVDLTLAPVPRFQDSNVNPSRHAVLAFIVAGARGRCIPTWGGLSTLDQAATLNTWIREAQAAQEQVLVSFGGARGPDLAVSCADPTQLESAYETVVARYNLSTIDLDVEGPASLSSTVAARRAQAIAAVQRGRLAAGRPLAVWLTLTVSPSGLEPDGVAAIQQMLSAGVKIAGVNAMTFDYGPLAGQTLLSASESALTATAGQLQSLYRSHDIPAGPDGLWPELGATIMEGRTDTAGQVWNISDVRALYGFALAHHLGRLSEWSLARDQPCSGAPPQPSDSCSGVPQQPLQFAENLLGRGARVQPDP